MIKDTYRLNGFSPIKFPKLKGHIKLTLHNCKNGKNEVVEGDNIITNAVRDIFANNYLGAIDYSKTMPLWSNWYGGILCYENAFAVDSETGLPDPDDYFIQGNDVNECIAHAGGSAIPTDHDDDLLRGSPTTSAFQYSENSVKQVWEWLPSHGNSNKTISALSLTHKDTGDAGTGTPYYAFQNFSPFALIQGSQLPASNLSLRAVDNSFAMYDDNHSLWFHIGEPSQYQPNRQSSFETKKLTIIIRRLPYVKAGLYETFHANSDYARSFTVETTGASMFLQPSYYFDYTTKYLWIFYNNTTTVGVAQPYWWNGGWDTNDVSYFVVDCENETIVDEGTIHSDTSNLLPLSYVETVGAGYSGTDNTINAQLVKDGNYVYFPTGTVESNWTNASYYHTTGYKKINISSQADQISITFNSTQDYFKSAIKNGGLIINSGRVVNNNIGYTCNSQFQASTNTYFSGVWAYQQLNKVSTLVMPIGASTDSGNVSRYLIANKLVNTSKWNLPTPVQKTASQSMSIEYTITEVDPDEE